MAKEANKFEWSARAAEEFETCRRKRFWANYGAMPEWNRLRNIPELMQQTVCDAAHWMINEWSDKRAATAAEAYEQVARHRLNEAWSASRSGAWRQSGSKALGLQEIHYSALHSLPPDWPQLLKTDVLACLEYFIEAIGPRLRSLPLDQEVKLPQTIPWEAEHALITVDADFVHESGDRLCIHVWDTGAPGPAHARRIAVLVWWAHRVLKRPPESIQVWLSFLKYGHIVEETGSSELIDQAEAMMIESMQDMSDYLEQTDRPRNRPLPKEEWDMTPERSVCRHCRFYALCEPELGHGYRADASKF